MLGERVRQYEEQIHSYQAQVAAARQQSALIAPEVEAVRGLYAKKLVTITRLNQMERTAVDLAGSRAALEANIAQAGASIAEVRGQMLNVGGHRARRCRDRAGAGGRAAGRSGRPPRHRDRHVRSQHGARAAGRGGRQAGLCHDRQRNPRGAADPADRARCRPHDRGGQDFAAGCRPAEGRAEPRGSSSPRSTARPRPR